MRAIDRRLLTQVVAVAVSFATPWSVCTAQDTVRTREGLVEVLGLKSWTARMLIDTLEAGGPAVTPFSPGCIAELNGRLRFPAAHVERYATGLDSATRVTAVIIRVVDWQDSARISLRPPFATSAARVDRWTSVYRIVRADTGDYIQEPRLLYGMQLYRKALVDSASAYALAAQFPVNDRAGRLWAALRGLRGAADYEQAIQTLARDGNKANRFLAVAVLLNFPERDGTWWALTNALRDPHPTVRLFANVALQQLTRTASRSVDWRPAAPALRVLLSGTELAAFTTVLDMLARTRVSPALAPMILRANGELVLQQAGVLHPPSRQAARAFLIAISGHDYGDAVDRWAQWIGALAPPA